MRKPKPKLSLSQFGFPWPKLDPGWALFISVPVPLTLNHSELDKHSESEKIGG